MLKKLVAIVSAVVVAWCMWHGDDGAAPHAEGSRTAAAPSSTPAGAAAQDGAGTTARAAAPTIAASGTASSPAPGAAPRGAPAVSARAPVDSLERAIAAKAHDEPVTGSAVVTRVLRDDLQGSRHQRFLVRTDAGHSLLIAYNIDIAPRIAGLKAGNALTFAGEYVWNDRGGLVHWTHRDPAHRHRDGYIRYEGHLYR